MIGVAVYRRHESAPAAKCSDGVSRKLYMRSYWDGARWCMYGDTYFSVPAYVNVGKRKARGFAWFEDGACGFTCTNGVLPAWAPKVESAHA